MGGYASDGKNVLFLGYDDVSTDTDTVGWFHREILGEEYGGMKALMRLGVVRYLLKPKMFETRVLI